MQELPEARVQVAIRLMLIEVAVCDAIEQGKVGCCILFGGGFSAILLVSMLNRIDRIECLTESFVDTYSSSTRYGGAPNEVFKATFTDGTALMPTARPRRTAVVAVSRGRLLLLAMVVSSTNGIAVSGRPLRRLKVDRKRGNQGTRANSSSGRPDEAVTCYLAELTSP